MLLNLRTRGKKTHGGGKRKVKEYESYEDRWESHPDTCFSQVLSAIVRRLCIECSVCKRKINDYLSSGALFGWHGDHKLRYWKKICNPSKFATKGYVRRLLMEYLKCCLVCGFCHENGKIKNYEEKLEYECRLDYDFGLDHRSARQVLQLREFQLFILELKARDAYFVGDQPKMSWETMEYLVWNYFGIILQDVSYCTSDEYHSGDRHRARKVNTVVMNIMKKLGVKCGHCGRDFIKHNPARMSGVHMDHRGKKRHGPSEAVGMHIDIFIEEMKVGDCDPSCCFCHGDVTF